MKTPIRILLPIILFAFVAFLAMSFSPVLPADPVVGATDLKCYMLDTEGYRVITEDFSITATQNNAGNSILKCYASGVYNPTGKTVVKRGASESPCLAIGGLSTSNWRQIISRDGDATLICNFNGK